MPFRRLGERWPDLGRRGLGSGVGGGGVSTATLIYDQFTDTNGTLLPAHTIAPTNTLGISWVSQTGVWRIITGGKATVNTGNARQATLAIGKANVQISVKAKNNQGASVLTDTGIIARWSDTNNFWVISIGVAAGAFRITEFNAGTPTIRVTTAVTINNSTEYTISANISGTTISATLDGANPISYASATHNQSATVHGIYARTDTGDTLDDFIVVG